MSDLDDFSGTVPLFPLPSAILFPRTILPLHIFEPRYRAMVSDALEGEKLIAIALLKPGWEPEYYHSPEVFPVIGIGRVIQEQRLEDGRYNILLQGVSRARIIEPVGGEEYRRAKVDLVREPAEAPPQSDRMRLALLAVYSTLLKSVQKNVPVKIEAHLPLGTLCDLLTAFLDVDIYEKQAILEELDPAARAARTVELLRKSSAAAQPVASGLREAERRNWPPKPTLN